MGFFTNIINSVKKALNIGQPKQLGQVYVKPSEVSQVSKGTSYSVPETGESGVKGVSKTSGSGKTASDLVPTGNIQTELSNSQTTSEVSATGSGTQTGSPSSGYQTNQTIQTSKGNAIVTEVNPDGSYSYKTEDGQFTYVDANGKESTLYSGGAMPITAEDIMTVIGVAGLVKGLAGFIGSAFVKGAGAEIAKAAAGQTVKKAAGSAGNIAVNTVNAKLTATWLSKAVGVVKDPKFVIGGVMAAIGSYPFAGFIKEEALQTIGLATKSAIDNGDLEAADKALAMQNDILNPDMWGKIIQSVPYANVASSLQDFFKTAAEKMEIDTRNVEKLRVSEKNRKDMEVKIMNDEASDWEIAQYMADNPFSALTSEIKRIRDLQTYGKPKYDSEGNLIGKASTKEYGGSAGGTYDSNGTYIPSKFEGSSTLSFGLLKTGSETTAAKTITKPKVKTITLEEFNGLSKDELALLSQAEIAAIKKRLGI